MATTPSFLHPDTTYFDFPISQIRRGSPEDVIDELQKLERHDATDKSEGQIAAETIAEIDSLHEPTPASQISIYQFEKEHIICAECWTIWPCSTHRAIYGESKENCVHRL